jgi:hypothetical protein
VASAQWIEGACEFVEWLIISRDMVRIKHDLYRENGVEARTHAAYGRSIQLSSTIFYKLQRNNSKIIGGCSFRSAPS